MGSEDVLWSAHHGGGDRHVSFLALLWVVEKLVLWARLLFTVRALVTVVQAKVAQRKGHCRVYGNEANDVWCASKISTDHHAPSQKSLQGSPCSSFQFFSAKH
ncbi:unnamed protein product [Durusdinium trenchii]|uniref:Uncharacterized protein n=1 Tax=Durusdinium trenchii TaxID=1381693 RepID=A0ABP0RRU3_9DINO